MASLATKRGPGKREVRAALARVLASQPFRSSPRLQSLLTFLVEEVLAGRGESLVQYRVATEGLGLRENFDPEKRTLVRSHAGRLRKALAAYYEGEGSGDKIIITLPASGTIITSPPLTGSITGISPEVPSTASRGTSIP